MPFLRTNPDLLRRFRKGDRAALEEAYDLYVREVDRYLHALLARNRSVRAAAVGDVLQETFIRAFGDRARKSYDGERDYGPYLKVIARNCLYDWLRRFGREVLVAPTELHALEGAPSVSAQHGVDPMISRVVSSYVEGLSHPLREVYEHRYVRAVSQLEACRELRITRSQLRTREDTLRSGLKRALVSAGIFNRPAPSMPSREVAG